MSEAVKVELQNHYTAVLYIFHVCFFELSGVMQVNAQVLFCVKELACVHWRSGCALFSVFPMREEKADGKVGGGPGCLREHCIRVDH